MRQRLHSCHVLIRVFFSSSNVPGPVLRFLSVRAFGATKTMPRFQLPGHQNTSWTCGSRTVSGGAHPRSSGPHDSWTLEAIQAFSAEPTGLLGKESAREGHTLPLHPAKLMVQEGKAWDHGEQWIEVLLLPGADPGANEGPHFLTRAQVFTSPTYQIFITPIHQWLTYASCPLFQTIVFIGVTLSLLSHCILGVRWRQQQLPIHGWVNKWNDPHPAQLERTSHHPEPSGFGLVVVPGRACELSAVGKKWMCSMYGKKSMHVWKARGITSAET